MIKIKIGITNPEWKRLELDHLISNNAYKKIGAQSDAPILTTPSHKSINIITKLSLLTLNVNGIKGKLTFIEFVDYDYLRII